jgi:hypothetical protein
MSYGDSPAEIEDVRLMEKRTRDPLTVISLDDYRQAIAAARTEDREAALQTIDEEIQGYEGLPSLGATSAMQYQYLRGCVEGLRIARNCVIHPERKP